MTALAALLVISGCSSVPDYANPVEWYNSAASVFDDDAPPPLPVEDIPGANEPFPELAGTPEAPLREIKLGTLDEVGEGLVADRANAQYVDEVLRSGGETTAVETPTLQAEPLPTYQAAPVPPLEPATGLQAPPLQPATQQSVLQPVAQPIPQPVPVGRGIDVKAAFSSLFASSGPLGVAPAGGGTKVIGGSAPFTPAITPPSATSLTSLNLASAGSALFGVNKAAVIYFDRGSARINKLGRDALHKVADYHKKSGGTLRVVGHASNRTKELSSVRHELVNFNISFKRARAVADELVRQGVAPGKLEIVAMSDSEPAYQEWMPSGEAGNRRTEVFIEF